MSRAASGLSQRQSKSPSRLEPGVTPLTSTFSAGPGDFAGASPAAGCQPLARTSTRPPGDPAAKEEGVDIMTNFNPAKATTTIEHGGEPSESLVFDVAVVAGVQAGLAIGYYLQHQGLRFVILEAAG